MARLWEVGQAACPGRAAPSLPSRSLLQGPGTCLHSAWHHNTIRSHPTLCSSSSRRVLPGHQHGHPPAHPLPTPGGWPQPQPLRSRVACCASMASDGSNQEPKDEVYPLQKTQVLVETAMLAAVGGLSYLLSTLLKLEGSLGYFLPLPIVLSAMRGGHTNGFKTMTATGFLIVVLLGPLKAISYILMHGLLAATLGSMWRQQANFWLCVLVGAGVRMCGQILYLLLSSVTMNENLFAIMLSNVYAMLDQAVWSVMGMQGSPAPVAIISVLCALTLVNALCYVFLLQIIYRIILQSMGHYLGPLPGIVRKYLYAGMPDEAAQKQA